jgi:hypothetical protein
MKSRLFTKVFVVLTSFLFVAAPAFSVQAVELFRYRYHADDGRKFECVFETDEKNTPRTVGEEKAAEIAADWVTSFYHVQVGALETQEFRARPIAHWLFCFSDTIKGPIERMLFVVVLPNGMVVQPKVTERL